MLNLKNMKRPKCIYSSYYTLEKQFMVWCYAYYVLGESLVDDKVNDQVCTILKNNPELVNQYKAYINKSCLKNQGYMGDKGWPSHIATIAWRLVHLPNEETKGLTLEEWITPVDIGI